MANRWTPRGFVRTPSLLQRCWVVDGKQPSGKTKDLYDSAVQKLPVLDEPGLSLRDASNKSEWHNMTRSEALAARAASRLPAQVAAQRTSASPKRLHHPHNAQLAPRYRRQHANLSPGETRSPPNLRFKSRMRTAGARSSSQTNAP